MDTFCTTDDRLISRRDGKSWIAVASAEHVRIGRNQGFMQVCHGKSAPLKRIRPGDVVVYYSPTDVFRGADKLQSFTAIGVVCAGEPYRASMSADFHPFRRDVAWHRDAAEVPIKPLLPHLSFSAGKRNWGYQLRFGLFEISADDMSLIARTMGVSHADACARDGARTPPHGAAVVA